MYVVWIVLENNVFGNMNSRKVFLKVFIENNKLEYERII